MMGVATSKHTLKAEKSEGILLGFGMTDCGCLITMVGTPPSVRTKRYTPRPRSSSCSTRRSASRSVNSGFSDVMAMDEGGSKGVQNGLDRENMGLGIVPCKQKTDGGALPSRLCLSDDEGTRIAIL